MEEIEEDIKILRYLTRATWRIVMPSSETGDSGCLVGGMIMLKDKVFYLV